MGMTSKIFFTEELRTDLYEMKKIKKEGKYSIMLISCLLIYLIPFIEILEET